MPLTLGKVFDRNYTCRVPFLDGFYNIGVYFNRKSTFLLFRVDPEFSNSNYKSRGIKINMFKNLESSKFSETFLKLHNYRSNNLDIINQFQDVKSEYFHDINFVFNETLKLSKIEVPGRDPLFDILTLYAFCMTLYENEFIFIVAERQNIVKKLEKKIVRTTGVQIGTSRALQTLNEFHIESLTSGKEGLKQKPAVPSDEMKIITLD